jgi:localization factor PodJL
LRANPAARIAASEAALGGTRPADAPAGKSSFIAAARRAAQAAGQEPAAPPPRAASAEEFDSETPSLRAKMMKRVKSLFIASCIIAAVIGSIQIAGTLFEFGRPATKTVEAPAARTGKTAAVIQNDTPAPAPRIAAQAPALSALPGMAPLGLPPSTTVASNTLAPGLNQTGLGLPSLLSPPLLGNAGDITGSIPRPAVKSAATRPAAQPDTQSADRLPSAIGGIHLRSAAVAGDPAAAFEIAARYAEGHGVPANAEEAARWYERAASKGVAPAEFRYASMLEKGQGVKKDLAAARRYYLAAAAKGNGKAMHNVAVLFAEGIDGKPDYANAVQWFRKAAQRGIPDSQYNLGVLCARGLGTAKSYPEAYKWFALAAAQGDQESAKKRDDVASHMDAAVLAAAQQTVKTFVAEPQPREANVVAEPPGGWDHAASAPARAKPASGAPLSLGSFKVGNR